MIQKNQRQIRIDLDQFKLYIRLKPDTELTLHFDSPSRRFYLSLIGLVVHEMKKRGKLETIPLRKHIDILALLNETAGGAAGSSKMGQLLPRIYRKWKDVLPDLENAPLFKVVGRKKRYDETMNRVYIFSEKEKDAWANLFEYKGSHENLRLKFSFDHLGSNLDDLVIVFNEHLKSSNEDAWDRFIEHLKLQDSTEKESLGPLTDARPWSRSATKLEIRRSGVWQWSALISLACLIVGSTLLGFWRFNVAIQHNKNAEMEQIPFRIPKKPSIAVLPFRNLSSKDGQDYFSDGLTEEIITVLSKVSQLFVIARNSIFSYKGKSIRLDKVSRELGVRYVLEGSVMIDGDLVRITAQLNDVIKGRNLWAEHYDRELHDIFTIQDDIALNILAALSYKLTGEEHIRLLSKSTKNIDAYLKVLEGCGYMYGGNVDAAMRYFDEAAVLDPNYTGVYSMRALAQLYNFIAGPRSTRWQSFVEAKINAKKCIELDDEFATCDMVMGQVHLVSREYTDALIRGKRAVESLPNSSIAAAGLASTLRILGRYDEAIREIEKALRLNPIRPIYELPILGTIYFEMGRHEDAIEACKKAIDLSPSNLEAYMVLVFAYCSEHRLQEARSAAQNILRLRPDFIAKDFQMLFPNKIEKDIDNIVDGIF